MYLLSYAGFGGENMDPAPGIGFNITYRCADGKINNFNK